MKTNHQMNYYDYAKTLSAEGVMTALIGGIDTHEYVDLGLPSRILWAKNNIQDADGNELYFAWGEISGYTAEQIGTDKNFSWDADGMYPNDYVFGPINWNDTTNYGMTKYNETDSKKVLYPEDDAATVNWGKMWSMPTKENFMELSANTTSAWTVSDNGISGVTFTSIINGNTLFFPAAGIAMGGMINGKNTYGLCWSKSLYNEYIGDANLLYFNNRESRLSNNNRYYGLSIRPIHI